MFLINIENFKKLKYHIFFKKRSILCFAYRECGHKYKKIFKEEESTEILKSLGLTSNKKSIRKYKIMNQESWINLDRKKYRWNKKLFN